jgi:hypothetical protein
MNDTVRLAVLGAGLIGKRHIEHIIAEPHAELDQTTGENPAHHIDQTFYQRRTASLLFCRASSRNRALIRNGQDQPLSNRRTRPFGITPHQPDILVPSMKDLADAIL